MSKTKIMITKKHRFFTLDEAQCIYEILCQANPIFKLREITKNAYAIEIIQIEDIEKAKLKHELKQITATIYKTTEPWKAVIKRQKDRDLKNHQLTGYQKESIVNA